MKPGGRGTLYVVATPIGNLGDITHRALKVLGSCDLIISEDTRTTRLLLGEYAVKTPVSSYYSPRERFLAGKYIEKLNEGADVALVSERGTPCISDPGFEIVRRAHEEGITVVPVPGPSALPAALSASGLSCKEVFFSGFLPRKKGARRRFLEKHLNQGYTLVFYDSKYRIVETMSFVAEITPGLTVCLCREMTKKFEELIRGSSLEVYEKIRQRTSVKGEFTVVCSPSET